MPTAAKEDAAKEGAALEAPTPDGAPAATRVARVRPRKAPGAFRTISEVADELHIPQHVLRFWETKFVHVRPLKRGGGRRYYRPDDVMLLRRIADLLYIQGYTIKGVQRLLREGNGRLADEVSPPVPEDADGTAELALDAALSPELPLPGLLPTSRPRRRDARPDAQPSAVPDEVAWLRAVLMETLAELRAIRALLP